MLTPVACASTTCGPGCTTRATPTASPAAAYEWPTDMGDNLRHGAGPSSPLATKVAQAWQAELDGATYASPLLGGGRAYVATENDTVYALDEQTGRELWKRHLGEPVPRARMQCGNIDPSGITSTPALSPDGSTLYVSGFLLGQPQPAHHLFALATSDGAMRWDRPDDPPGLDPLVEQQRGALALAGAWVYVPFGGLLGDCGAYKGAVVGIPRDGGGQAISYIVPAGREGGIWAPPGEIVDDAGRLLIATGNTASGQAFDHANSVIRLDPTLHETDLWAPADWAALSARDADLGSSAPVALFSGLIFIAGKTGRGYLLRGDHLGGIGGEFYSAMACSAGVFGGVAYTATVLYVPCSNRIAALQVSGERFAPLWESREGGETPIIAYGRVWTVARSAGDLVALDPASGAVSGRWPIGPLTAHFTTPAAAGGRVYVSGSTRVYAFSVA